MFCANILRLWPCVVVGPKFLGLYPHICFLLGKTEATDLPNWEYISVSSAEELNSGELQSVEAVTFHLLPELLTSFNDLVIKFAQITGTNQKQQKKLIKDGLLSDLCFEIIVEPTASLVNEESFQFKNLMFLTTTIIWTQENPL